MLPRNQTGLVIGIGLVIAMMVVNAGVAYRETQLLHDDSQRVAHSHEVRFALGEVLSIVKDAETGQRGFIITGDASYLEPYSAALGSYQEETSALDKLIVDNPRQQEAAKRLKELIERRLGELAESIELRKEQGYEAGQQFVAKGRGKQTMQQIRAVAAEMQEYEDDLLADRERNHDRTYRSALMTDVVATVLGLAAVVAFGWLLRKHLSALMKSADQIHEHRELLRATLVSIGDGVIATDAAGRVTFLNTVAENLTGWSQTEAASKPLDTVFSIVNEATRKPVENPALRALREGRIVELANHTVLLSKDGTQWPIDDSAAPITGEGGEVNGVILVFREIRQRKIHEQELLLQTEALEAANQRKSQLVETLRQSEEQFRTLADSIPQLAWMSKNDGTIVWYNKRWYEFTGAAPGVMAGWGLQSALDPAELPRILAKFQAALASGEPWEDTFALRRHDGQMRWHLSRAMPLRDEQGQIVWWFGTNTDITEQLQMEDALKEADRRKDEFLAILAHELRNPLSPLSNALQLWPFVENDRAEMERLREMMERQVQQMIRLIDDLMDVSRITRGKIQLRKQPVDLGTLISGAVESIQPFLESHGHQLTLTLPTEPVTVDGDVARLTQVFGNILHNAAKYAQSGGVIWVSAERKDGWSVVKIRDNGPGIPQHMLTQIFEMFRQVDQTLDRSDGGLGIGLTLVKRLVDLHGGTVEARSEGPGKGSEFIVSLPAVPADPTVASDGAARHVLRHVTSLPRRQILVVDDVKASAMTLAMMLRSIGQEVSMVHDGPQAVDWVLAHKPDVVFLDIAMPGMNGYEVARKIRELPGSETILLVALTGYGQDEDRRRAIEAGFEHHLIKPMSIEILQQVLTTSPGQKRLGDGEPVAAS